VTAGAVIPAQIPRPGDSNAGARNDNVTMGVDDAPTTPAVDGPLHTPVAPAREGLLGEPRAIVTLIVAVAGLSLALLAVWAPEIWRVAGEDPVAFVAFGILAGGLTFTSVEIYGRGAVSFAGCGLLATGFALGPGPALLFGVLVAAINFGRRGGLLYRAVFDAGTLALAAAAAAQVFDRITAEAGGTPAGLGVSVIAAMTFLVVNLGLLSMAMGLSEGINPASVWQERFRWLTPYYLASGPLAFAMALAYDRMGVIGLAAFALPPAFMMVSARQYLAHTAKSVEEIRRANADLQTLFVFAGGLAARAHDSDELRAYAEQQLTALLDAEAEITREPAAGSVPLHAGAKTVGWLRLRLAPGADEQWERLQEALVPQLATAFESAHLVDELRRSNRDLIAALSRSMEAKDYYTGGHTERVSRISVALAERLGYTGPELTAIEIGSLVHDIGKIGIPESILNKPGPLTDEEWEIMKEHPVISDFILAEINVHPYVRQIARWSHERLDGRGYPDGLAADEIPEPARIVLVADAFDALTSDRPYRPGRTAAEALDEIRLHVGTQFCPRVVAELEGLHRDQPEALAVVERVLAGAA
jgi:HD-GYP domain-containing protein (c-di-GMP phosphodiesterase class II)